MTLLITDGLPRGLGYVEVDNRPAGCGHFEADTYTCTHCSAVVILNPERKRERYKCRYCNHHVCDDCAAKMTAGGSCYTMQQYIDESLERATLHPEAPPIIPPWER